MQYKVFAMAARPAIYNVRNRFRVRSGKPLLHDPDTTSEVIDPAPKEDQVPAWTWVGLLVIATIITCAIMASASRRFVGAAVVLITRTAQFDVNVGLSILSIVLGFIFSVCLLLLFMHTH